MADPAPDAIARLDVFLDLIGDVLRRPAHRAAFATYVTGLTSEAERKSLEPLATRAVPVARAAAAHQALHHFVANATWSDHAVRRVATAWGLWGATRGGPVRVAIVDDTGLLKQGTHSVGVARQYTGSAGKVANCQVAVSLCVATDFDTVPVDVQLYLPEDWAFDAARRRAAKIPDDVLFQTKGELARDMVHLAHAEGVPLGDVVLADADYGRSLEFRREVTALGLAYGVGVYSSQHVAWRGEVATVRALAAAAPVHAFQRRTWREGTKRLSARFLVRRVRVANDRGVAHLEGTPQWLVIEWRDGDARPEHFHLTTVAAGWSHKRVIRTLKERWRTERFYEDAKGELGLDHYEGRRWPGWNHHVSVVLCCYALLVGERAVAFPPSTPREADARPHGRPPTAPRRRFALQPPSRARSSARRTPLAVLPRLPTSLRPAPAMT